MFYVDRKKCWLLTNGLTKYNFILADIKASDLDKIEEIFKNTLYSQLAYDGIIMDYDDLDSILGGLDFLPTDNDRGITGFQNHRLYELDIWKYHYGSLENIPIKDLAHRMNKVPFHIGKSRKMSDYTYSTTEMKKLLMG